MQEARDRILSGDQFLWVYTLLVTLTKRARVAPHGGWRLTTAPAKGSLSRPAERVYGSICVSIAARYRNIEVPPLLVGIYPVSNTYKAGVGRTIRCQNRSGGSGERFTLKYGSKPSFFSENIFLNIFFRVENNSGAFWELFW